MFVRKSNTYLRYGLAVFIAASLLMLTSSPMSYADSVNNNANAIHLTVEGPSEEVGYSIKATGQGGCDVSADNPVTIALEGVPTGVVSSPSSLIFTSCEIFQTFTFAATESAVPNPDGPPYKVSVVVLSGTGVDNLTGGNLNIFVNGAEAPVDTIPPTVTGTPDRAPNENGWYNSPVTVTWTADEPATCDSPTVYGGPDIASIELQGQCEDEAGNIGTGSVTISYDSTAPEITVGNTEYIIGQPVGSYAECADSLSGVAECNVPAIDTSSAGSGSVTVSASDNAGNGNSVTVNYSVNYGCVDGDSFQTPVPNATHKTGRTLPVKFAACDYYGNPVEAVGATLYVDGTPASSKGGSNTGNLFRYDASGGISIFNLDTTGLVTGNHTLKADLGNGQTIVATFTIVK